MHMSQFGKNTNYIKNSNFYKNYRSLYNQSSVGVFRTSLKSGSLLRVNRIAHSILGFNASHLKETKLTDIFVDPAEREKLREQLLKFGLITNWELRLYRKDGHKIWVSISAVVNHERGYIDGVMTDISFRKQTEEELKQYEFLVNQTGTYLTLIDRDYTYRAANKAYLKAHNRMRDDVIGKTVSEIWGDETFNNKVKKYLDRSFAGEKIRYHDWFEFPAAGLSYIDVTYSPYKSAGGDILGVVVTSNDITERYQAEIAYQKSEVKYRTLFQTTFEGLAVLEGERIVDVNRSFLSIFGVDSTDAIGSSIRSFISEEFHDTLEKIIEGDTEIYRLSGVNRGSDSVILKISGKKLRWQDQWATLIALHDITEEVQMENQLLIKNRQAQMGEMLGMIAHQWRQPLTSIGALAGKIRVRHSMGTIKSNEINDTLQNIERQIQFLSQTISNFRNFFTLNQKNEAASIKDIIQKTLDIIHGSLESDSIKIEQTYEEDSMVEVRVGELMQVFLNIFQNSQDAFREKGMENPCISINISNDDRYVTTTISDNAGGIPKDSLQYIFKPYYTTKTAENGTGMGLYMSRIIVEEHFCGSLLAENRGEGAAFTVRLPVAGKNVKY